MGFPTYVENMEGLQNFNGGLELINGGSIGGGGAGVKTVFLKSG